MTKTAKISGCLRDLVCETNICGKNVRFAYIKTCVRRRRNQENQKSTKKQITEINVLRSISETKFETKISSINVG